MRLCASSAQTSSHNNDCCKILLVWLPLSRRAVVTSCARDDTICLRPLKVDNIFAFIRQVAPVPACWLLRHQQQVYLSSFDLESGVRVTCDVGYLCANFSLPRPLCSRIRPDVRDRQTDRRQTSDKSIV